jgi:hypothetical protein
MEAVSAHEEAAYAEEKKDQMHLIILIVGGVFISVCIVSIVCWYNDRRDRVNNARIRGCT